MLKTEDKSEGKKRFLIGAGKEGLGGGAQTFL